MTDGAPAPRSGPDRRTTTSAGTSPAPTNLTNRVTMRPSVTGGITAGATALGVAAVLILNPSGAGTSVASTIATGSVSGTTSGSGSTTTQSGTSSSSGTTSGSDSSGSTDSSGTTSSDSSGSTTSGSSSTDSGSTSSDSSSSSSSATDGTYTGAVYESPYGAMQVQATISDGTITDIEWVQLPSDGHSQRINSQAAPTLVEEGLSAQSADVASVSGATYTSTGFQQSLQSALSQAGLS